eukprot:TRINITY_DN2867_c0_g1_i1.p1 TRINITY_DN2867_c0_g1~~TRINITY_DN2867_c0_g1_i1.p1  ORF type:complete len:217 (+),score=21.62 TRINITY_DN2867_c0_g1_i1:56-652(+)
MCSKGDAVVVRVVGGLEGGFTFGDFEQEASFTFGDFEQQGRIPSQLVQKEGVSSTDLAATVRDERSSERLFSFGGFEDQAVWPELVKKPDFKITRAIRTNLLMTFGEQSMCPRERTWQALRESRFISSEARCGGEPQGAFSFGDMEEQPFWPGMLAEAAAENRKERFLLATWKSNHFGPACFLRLKELVACTETFLVP